MSETSTQKTDKSTLWTRGAYMVLFLAIGSLVTTLAAGIAIFQFLSWLLSGATNPHLHTFSRGLTLYCQQILEYLLFLTEEKPYPFKAWPTITQAVATETTTSSSTQGE